ncbi:MAG: 50S ribosomal protein L25 [Candidatus Marinimicrobia bacterium]|nr:50S ribosomal protein L25 [Candidatus Neomarinimicrobiota bacterium]MBL7046745.1 50S ribosomal protein L25 [Candidatus Neomarinimicrobiota bacterium]
MAYEFKLKVERRKNIGKQAAKHIRQEGKIPGIFYSSDVKPIPFVVDRKHLQQAFQSEAHVYAVTVGRKKVHAIFKEVQYHPVTDEVLHVDLFGIRLKDRINIMVHIMVEGEPVGVKAGGVLTQNVTELEISCLATEVPDAIRIDVSELDLGGSIHAGEVDLGEVELVTNPETTVVSVNVPRKAEMEIEVPEVEIEEVEEVEEVEEAEEEPEEREGEEEPKS